MIRACTASVLVCGFATAAFSWRRIEGKARASRRKAMSCERMQAAEVELKAQADALLERAETNDAAETDAPELDIPVGIERRKARLKAIAEARKPPGQRQHEADIECGRSDDDECLLRDEDRNPEGGHTKRDLGVAKTRAPGNFTDPAGRIMKRAGGGFDPSDSAQTVVEDTAHIIVAAAVGNIAADVGQRLPVLKAVRDNTGQAPEQMSADACQRSKKDLEDRAGPGSDLVVALGSEGKLCAGIDAQQSSHTGKARPALGIALEVQVWNIE